MTTQGKTITAKTTAAQAARSILTGTVAEFAEALADLRHHKNPEGPHKSRVALRRLLVALQAFTPIIAPAKAKLLKRRLKVYFKTIGRVRDADVLALATPSGKLQAKADRIRRKVRKSLQKQRANHLAADMKKLFGGKGWHRSGTKAARHGSVQDLAVSALRDSWNECLSHGTDLAALAAPKRHELRKSLKTFRYLSDYFGVLWPSGVSAPILDQLPALQDDLGKLNDLAMARAHGLAPDDAAEALTLAHAAALWSRLAHCPTWWD